MLELLAQAASKTAAKLFLFAVIGIGILAYVFEQTREHIAQSIHAKNEPGHANRAAREG